MIFLNETHENFYKENMEIEDIDCCQMAVIYLLGLTEDTMRHFGEICNLTTGRINPQVLNEPWQTTTTTVIIKLAFNLFNDCTIRRNKRLHSKQHIFKAN